MIQNTQAETGLNPLAILFTNAGGRVVFANRNFLQLTDGDAAKKMTGERLEVVLPMENRNLAKINAVINGSGSIDRLPVSVLTPAGKSLPLLFSGVAAYGGKGDYIGSDIFLHKQFTPAPPDSPTVPALQHTAVLKMYVSEVFDGTRMHGNTFMQGYVHF